MGYEIQYDMDKDAAQQAAIRDIKNWSEKVYVAGFEAIMAGYTYNQLAFLMSFGGVQGYPVVALWEYVKECLHDMTE